MRRLRELAIFLVVLGLGPGAVVARAEEDGPAPVDTEESVAAGAADVHLGANGDANGKTEANPSGTYTGVHPGGAEAPPVPAVAGQQPVMVTWPGFQMRADGTSRVFIQSTAPVGMDATLTGRKFTLKLSGARVAGDTNRLPLETRYFNTPVTRVSIEPTRDAVSIVLDLRADVSPQVSSERGASGFHFTYIDLPAGQFVEGARPAPASRSSASGAPTPSVDATPDHLDGNLDVQKRAGAKSKASARVDTSMDNELPPSVKSSNKAQGGVKLGK